MPLAKLLSANMASIQTTGAPPNTWRIFLATGGSSEPPFFMENDMTDEKKTDAKEKLIPVRINRDFWDADGTRHRKGTVVEVPVEAALDGVETGALSRVK